jgi:hypothetical protein
MSAWVVSKRHIDLLVTAIVRSESVDTGGLSRDEIGRWLWRENVRSVNYRYSERDRTPAYRYRAYELPHYLAILKQVECYQYQACERPDWPQSTAYRWTTALRELLAQQAAVQYPEASFFPGEAPAEYEAAPWGV